MGVLKKRIQSAVNAATGKAKNAVQRTADTGKALTEKNSNPTQKQIQALNEKREEYLNTLQGNEEEQIKQHLAGIESQVFQSYLPRIKELYTIPETTNWETYKNRIAWFDITKWVIDPAEDSIEKLCSVYQVLSGEECSIALIYHRSKKQCEVRMAVCNNRSSEDSSIVQELSKRVKDALRGNFPGAIFGFDRMQQKIPHIETDKVSVAIVSNLATEKSERFISQSIEKLLDGIVPRADNGSDDYTIVLLANPILDNDDYLQNLYAQYTAISPFAQVQKQSSISDSTSVMSTANSGVNAGAHLGGGTPCTPNAGISFGVQIGYSAGSTIQVGKSEAQTLTYSNYEIKHCMDRIEQQMKRLQQCQALGMWDFAAYVISKDYSTTQNVAHMYVSLTQGKESYLESSAINVWNGGNSKKAECETAKLICTSLQCLQHPQFCLDVGKSEGFLFFPELIDASIMVSGSELAHALNFPRKSISGLPVFECVPFGREVVLHTEENVETPTEARKSQEKPETVQFGNIYHMRHSEDIPVALLKDSLASHTFITGSTGAGKSNAVYTMINGLCPYYEDSTEDKKKASTHFLVIEPAKGEYKDVFGGRNDVDVYGTNPKKANLLRLNPFSFPTDIHVLEHIDRLVEVFNACWPMFAAMPAVLKASIEYAYSNCGWNLQTSSHNSGEIIFPTFWDVMKALPEVVDSKGFSNDTQGDYKGALLTRLESLTNGINGQVLCALSEVSDEQLFDRNVIVDLSRVGSSETKALLMGILVLKLQEHRMDERENTNLSDKPKSSKANKGLHHITVLEEAHNLLRRSAPDQSQESANLQGKSVEMLTNAIAEMRTYGEGFIIVDQAPGLLDMAVIRNTNTKIILRLPDESDRKLVGKSAGLNDNQIIELSRLDTGVAAVYQNHWLEPVLCKITEFTENDMHQYDPSKITQNDLTTNDNFFRWLLNGEDILDELGRRHTRRWLEQLDAPMMAKQILVQSLETNNRPNDKEIHFAIYALTNGARLIENSRKQLNPEAYVHQQIQEMLQVHADQARLIQEQIYYYVLENKKPMEETLDSELRRVMMIR